MENENYFKFSELLVTQTGLCNHPTAPVHLDNLANLWRYLNSVRARLGSSVIINSAFRTPQVNEHVRGAKRSYHKEGRAADITCCIFSFEKLGSILEEDFRNGILQEFIKYSTFYHFAI